MQRKQRAEYKRNTSGQSSSSSAACCLSGARAPAYCLLAADSICRNLKDLLPRQHLLQQVRHLLQQTQQPILQPIQQIQQPIQQVQHLILQVRHLICGGISKQKKCKINVNKLTLDYPILWAGIAWRLLREICVSSKRQQLLPPRGSKFRVVMARCQNL